MMIVNRWLKEEIFRPPSDRWRPERRLLTQLTQICKPW